MAKPKASKYKTREECRAGMAELALIETRMAKWTAAAEARIRGYEEAVRKALAENVAPLLEVQSGIVADLFLFYKEHQAEIEADGKHSLVFPGIGEMKRVYSSSLQTLKDVDWPEVVKRLLEAGQTELVRTPEPEPDKQAIRAADLTAEELEAFGLKIVPASLKKQWGYKIYDTAAAGEESAA